MNRLGRYYIHEVRILENSCLETSKLFSVIWWSIFNNTSLYLKLEVNNNSGTYVHNNEKTHLL